MKGTFLLSLLLTTMVILAGGCTQQMTEKVPQQINVTNAELDTEFQLKWNETAFIKSDDLKIRFVDVLGDSRCPPKVTCVWEGQVSVLVNVIRNNQDLGNFNLKLRAGHDDVAVEAVDGHFIKILNAEPYLTNASKTIKPSEYTITLVVTKFH